MPYSMDPEVYAALKPMMEAMSSAPKIPADDIKTRRATIEPMFNQLLGANPFPSDVTSRDYYATASDGHKVLVRWYTKINAPTSPSPAIFHIHGGGMVMLSVDTMKVVVAELVSKTGVPVASVEYRLAPEHPHPTLVEDCYTGLTWFQTNAKELNVDSTRIAIMGESAGGGLAAAITLMARDRKFTPPLAKQILIYPMLDDRTTVPDTNIQPFAIYTYEENHANWKALLGDAAGTDDVSPYAAPARAKDLSNLPPAFIDVGQLDIFLYEDMEYANRLSQAGTDVEFHLRQGCPHGFDGLASTSAVSKRAVEDKLIAMTSF